MPALFLRQRQGDLAEQMDNKDGDRAKLFRTYDQFRLVNPVVSGWRTLYRRHIRPLAGQSERITLLDIGCGGGDVLERLARWARRDGLRIEFTGIDPDPRAMEYARQRTFPPEITFEPVAASDLVQSGRCFDVVISNHVLHHLDQDEMNRLLFDSRQLAQAKVLHNDIRRDDLAWLLFAPTRLVFHGSYTTADGLTSIRRSWRPDELAREVPPGWRVEAFGLFRNLVLFEV